MGYGINEWVCRHGVLVGWNFMRYQRLLLRVRVTFVSQLVCGFEGIWVVSVGLQLEDTGKSMCNTRLWINLVLHLVPEELDHCQQQLVLQVFSTISPYSTSRRQGREDVF